MPDNLTIDQVIDHIIFIDKVQKDLMIRQRSVNTKEEAKQKLSKWFK